MTGAPVVAIIVAGGTGERFGRQGGKQLLEVAGRPVLEHTVEAFASAGIFDAVVVVCHPQRVDEYCHALSGVTGGVRIEFTAGGASRQDSVDNGLAVAERLGAGIVAVHDGARPLTSREDIAAGLARLDADPGLAGVVVGHPVTDTLKTVAGTTITGTSDRSAFWAVQTPQFFRARVLREAIDSARAEGFCGTDDASLVERTGGAVGVVQGRRDNLKITVAEDAEVAGAILATRKGTGGSKMRIGIGYDVHAFAENRRLVLGGVEIEHELGLLGHSDADVLAHAVADAVLGALREGDIGKLFPDTDPAYEGADSMVLLAEVAKVAARRGWRVVDVDAVLVLERPKISPHREAMRENIAGALGVEVDSVGVKATTTEGLGFEGRGEGVGAKAVVLLERL